MSLKLYSFDVFDTCLVRVWARPVDLFLELGAQLQQEQLINIDPFDWQKLRIEAERSARKSVDHGEITIADIYGFLGRIFNWSQEQIEGALNKEVQLELRSLLPVSSMASRINNLRQQGNRILYISDMYLFEEHIITALKQHGFWHTTDTLYLSSRWQANKASGRLFKKCLELENIMPSNLSHIGDNYRADFDIPRQLGISSELFDETQLNRYERIVANSHDLPTRFRSILAGVSRLTRLQSPALEACQKVIWDTSASVVAPVLFGFVHWCLTEAQRLGIKRLYFVARDGQILHRVAEIICGQWGYNIDCRYLYGSRQAWHSPAILEIGELELDWIFDPTQFLSVESVCKRVNLQPFQIADQLERFGFDSSMWKVNLTNNQRQALRQAFQQNAIAELILLSSAIARKNVLGYLKQEGMGDGVPFAIVDIGWRGRLQVSLGKLLKSADLYPSNGLFGFYFALDKPVKNYTTDQLVSYFYNSDLSHDRKFANRFRPLIELFVTADHGGTMGFEYDSETDQYRPTLKYEKNIKSIDWGILVQQESICQFAANLTSHLDRLSYSEQSGLIASERLLLNFFEKPTLDESNTYGNFLFADDQVESLFYPLAPRLNLKDIVSILFGINRLPPGVWLPAVQARSHLLFGIFLKLKIIGVSRHIYKYVESFRILFLKTN